MAPTYTNALVGAIDIGDFVSGLTTLVAAFAGSWFAFVLAERKERRSVRQAQVAAGNRALFALARQHGMLVHVQTRVIDPHRNDLGRFLNMRPFLPLAGERPAVDLDSLAFMLATPERQVLVELDVEQARFHVSLDAMDERSRLHVEEAQPKLEAAGIHEQLEYAAGDIEGALGRRLYLHLQRSTDGAIEQVDLTVKSSLECFAKLRNSLIRLHPKASFISISPVGQSSPQSPLHSGVRNETGSAQ